MKYCLWLLFHQNLGFNHLDSRFLISNLFTYWLISFPFHSFSSLFWLFYSFHCLVCCYLCFCFVGSMLYMTSSWSFCSLTGNCVGICTIDSYSSIIAVFDVVFIVVWLKVEPQIFWEGIYDDLQDCSQFCVWGWYYSS